MLKNKLFFVFIWINGLNSYFKLKTSMLNYTDYTTGNLNEFDQKNYYLKNSFELRMPKKLNKLNKNYNFVFRYCNFYIKLTEGLILDFTNEDPKFYDPYSKSFPLILERRGFLAKLISFLFLIIFTIFFIIRFYLGGCGGFKTNIKKPSKKKKNFILLLSFITLLIFIIFQILILKNLSNIIINNKKINNRIKINSKRLKISTQNIKNDIKKINDSNLKTFYNDNGKFFHISNKIKFINIDNDEKNNYFTKYIHDDYDIINKYNIFLFSIIIILYLSYYYSFYKNKKYWSLIITILVLFSCIIYFNFTSNYFNSFTLILDIYKGWDIKKGWYQTLLNDNYYYLFFPILKIEEKKLIQEQLQNILIAKQSSFEIFKNLLKEENYYFILKNLKNYKNYMKNYDNLKQLILDTKNSYIIKYNELNKNLYDIETKLKNFYLKNLNTLIFQFIIRILKNINTFFMIKIYNIILSLSLLIFAFITFFSENIIKGIYQEKENYVNLSKLRYDWN